MGKVARLSDSLATRINRAHQEALAHVGGMLAKALEAGELLMQAKAATEHGKWTQWRSENCPDISDRTAQSYMRLARNKHELQLRSDAAEMSLREAIRYLSPNTPITIDRDDEPAPTVSAPMPRLSPPPAPYEPTAQEREQLKHVLDVFRSCSRFVQEWFVGIISDDGPDEFED